MELTNLSKSSSGNHDSSDGCEMCWCYRFLSLAMQGKRLFVCPCVLGSEDILVRRKVRSGSRSGLTTQGGEASVCPLLQRPAFVKSVLGFAKLACFYFLFLAPSQRKRNVSEDEASNASIHRGNTTSLVRCVALPIALEYYSTTTAKQLNFQ